MSIGKAQKDTPTTDDAGTLTISGTGEMFDYYGWGNTAPWKNEVFSRVIIENGMTSVGSYAFYNINEYNPHAQLIQSVTLADSVKKIGTYAFAYNVRMTTLNLGSDVEMIGEYAFCRCEALTQLTIPDSVTILGGSAFYACGGLSSITLGTGIMRIAPYTFQNCTALTEIIIPENVTRIEWGAFTGCSGIKTVSIPASINSIDSAAFDRCASLEGFAVDKANTTYCSVDGVLFNKDKTTLVQYPAGKAGETYTIPNSVTDIADYAFSSCTALTGVEIPNSVTNIGMSAFSDCTALSSVKIPDSVISFNYGVFARCTALTNITIPDSVMIMNRSAFAGCQALQEIIFFGDLPQIDRSSFYEVTANAYYPVNWKTVPEANAYNHNQWGSNSEYGRLRWLPYEMNKLILDKSVVTLLAGDTVSLTAMTISESGIDYQADWSSDNEKM